MTTPASLALALLGLSLSPAAFAGTGAPSDAALVCQGRDGDYAGKTLFVTVIRPAFGEPLVMVRDLEEHPLLPAALGYSARKGSSVSLALLPSGLQNPPAEPALSFHATEDGSRYAAEFFDGTVTTRLDCRARPRLELLLQGLAERESQAKRLPDPSFREAYDPKRAADETAMRDAFDHYAKVLLDVRGVWELRIQQENTDAGPVWTFHVGHHPDAYERVHAEIGDVLGGFPVVYEALPNPDGW